MGSEFRKTVWKILCDIPYGKVTTYKKIAVMETNIDDCSGEILGYTQEKLF